MARPKKKENVEENKSILLSEKKRVEFCAVFQKCVDKLDGQITEDEFINYLNDKIHVNNYLSLSYKSSMINSFYDSIFVDEELYDLAYLFEIFSVLIVLLAYTNINIVDEEMIEENYDVVMASGLVDYIKIKCNKDFELFRDMMGKSLNFRCYQSIKKFTISMDLETLEMASKQTQNMFKEIDTEKLSLIKEISEFNNPSLKNVQNFIYDATKELISEK